MSNSPIRPDRKKILDDATRERRVYQYEELRKWDMGKTTGLQCIESIIELEKIIFIGNKARQKPSAPSPQTEGKK